MPDISFAIWQEEQQTIKLGNHPPLQWAFASSEPDSASVDTLLAMQTKPKRKNGYPVLFGMEGEYLTVTINLPECGLSIFLTAIAYASTG